LGRKRPARRALHRGALFVFALLLCAPLGAGVTGEETEVAVVRWALDGDSLSLEDGRQVRLLGINAPELGKDGQPDQPLARMARDRASALTRGRTIRLAYDRERLDRYGRTLAYATLSDGRDLEAILLREGLAWFVAIPPNLAHLEQYRAAEAEARTARRGIWARPEYEPTAAEQLSRERTGFIRLAGIISAVHERKDVVELVLTPQVRLLLPSSVFTALGQSPERLRGKRILARGWLAAYKDQLRLRVAHPSMIEALS
jgi:micrococcal nuclease